MQIWFSDSRRITIPTKLVTDNNIQLNKHYDADFVDGNLIIYINKTMPEHNDIVHNTEIDNSYEQTDQYTELKPIQSVLDIKPKSVELEDNYKPVIKQGIKIESNLSEGQCYTKKKYTPCNLVIRTKSEYISKFCRACKGYLYKEYNLTDNSCPYIEDDTVSLLQDELDESKLGIANNNELEDLHVLLDTNNNTTSNELHTKPHNHNSEITDKIATEKQNLDDVQNIKSTIINDVQNIKEQKQRLSNILQLTLNKVDNEMTQTTKPDVNIKQQTSQSIDKTRRQSKNIKVRSNNTTLEVTYFDDYKKCSECGELNDTGFLIDGVFYCKHCAAQDFKDYYQTISRYGKEII